MNRAIDIFLFDNERKTLINKNLFLYNESRARILSNFKNIDNETDALKDRLIQGELYSLNPDISYEDECSFYADIEAISFKYYCSLKEMSREISLNIASMLYFNWDKTLRNWLLREIQHTLQIPNPESWLWRVDIGKIYQLLLLFNFNIQAQSFFKHLDSLRLIVNVYKHGNGKAYSDLEKLYPEYLNAEFGERGYMTVDNEYSRLKVSNDQLEEFTNSITHFWTSIPQNLHINDVDQITKFIPKGSKKNKKEA